MKFIVSCAILCAVFVIIQSSNVVNQESLYGKEKRSSYGYCNPSTGYRRSKCTSRLKMKTTYYKACGWLWRRRCKTGSKYWYKTTYYSCNKICSVTGGWSRWGGWGRWGLCTGNSCIGQQLRQRSRRCNNPRPRNGGRRCYGVSKQTSNKPCLRSVNGKWSSWSSWRSSGTCSTSCGRGSMLRTRGRSCSNPRPRCGGKYCYGSPKHCVLKPCYRKHCIVNGGWSSWHSWSRYGTCSKTCGSGKRLRYRERFCTNPVPKYGGVPCNGKSKDTDSNICNTQHCKPVDGKWSAWGNWGHFRHCSETCGYGVKYRYRYRACNDPEPENGGKKCPGLLRDEEFKRCHLRKCPKLSGNGKFSVSKTTISPDQKTNKYNLTSSSELNNTGLSSQKLLEKGSNVESSPNNTQLKEEDTFNNLGTNASMKTSKLETIPLNLNKTSE
ncbi:coadhesin-like [Ostrea edulis]|uniref:coadhesin-like n=1 Tax=Ostrea edulis TaxID=37623 RepID=UPI0024AFBE70|nr:coadhesin-like [Ostrea edulis]